MKLTRKTTLTLIGVAIPTTLFAVVAEDAFFATSSQNTINGSHASVVGISNTVGNYSSTTGHSNSNTGVYTISAGRMNNVSGSYSSGFGLSNQVTGAAAFAAGRSNTASYTYTTTLGAGNRAEAYSSHAWGLSNVASKRYAIAMGIRNIADGDYATLLGHRNTSTVKSWILGEGNEGVSGATIAGTYNNADVTDLAFMVGNGTSINRSNAVEVGTSGQTRLINRDWAAQANPNATPGTDLGRALVVDGHVLVNGNITVNGSDALSARNISIADSISGGGGEATGMNATAFGGGSATETHAFSATGGDATGPFATALAHADARGYGALAAGAASEAHGNWSTSIGLGTTSVGQGTIATGWYNDPGSRGTSHPADALHPDGHIFVIGNGTSALPEDRSNAVVVKQSGMTTITNKDWAAQEDPFAEPGDDEGRALVVEGVTELRGKVFIGHPQGDISMGIFQ